MEVEKCGNDSLELCDRRMLAYEASKSRIGCLTDREK